MNRKSYLSDLYNFVRIRAIASNNNFKVLSDVVISPSKGSKCFILGNGSSVNELTKKQWEEIENNYSIGINKWLISDHIPNAISIEKNIFKPLYSKLLSDERLISSRLNTIFFPLHSYLIENKFPFEIRNEIKESICLTVSRSKKISNEEELKSLIFNINIIEKIKRNFSLGFHYELGGSVFRLINIAIGLGFNEIVFVGVDLNSSSNEYFWEKERKLLLKREIIDSDLKTEHSFKIHPTEALSLKMSRIIELLSKSFFSKGITMKVSSKNSVLSNFLPLWN